jgi:MoxR-like ATPase
LGRDYVLPDDVKFIAPYVLSHRVIVSPSARLRNVEAREIVAAILEQLPMPEPERPKVEERLTV